MMKMNSIGAYRSLTNKYTDYRKELKNTVFHTKKQSLNDSVSSIFSENGKTTLLNQHLGNNKSNKNGPVELQHWNLPPRYMEIFDNTSDIFKEIQLKFTRLQEEQQKRITPRFNEEENMKLDKIIRELVYDLTKNIKNAEDNIKLITFEKVSSNSEKLVRDNMKVFLATKLQEYTRNLRNNEEGYIKKYQELCGGTDITGKFSQVLKTSEFGISVSNPTDPQAFLQIENSNDILKKRDTEINNLVNSLNDLTTVMKDLQSLVFEQGTILDRIDFNIEQAFDHHKKANVDLKISEENLKSGCARNSIIFLIILIFVLGICVLIKFTK